MFLVICLNEDLIEQIRHLKKIELHRHMEGCISPELFFELAKKYDENGQYSNFEEIKRLYDYKDFMGFLTAFETAVDYLRDLDDFKHLATTVILQLENDNVIYAELIFSPQPFLRKGFDLQKIMRTLHDEFAKSNIKTTVIIDFVRNFGSEEAGETLQELITVREEDSLLKEWIKVVSIGGDEVNYPARLFVDVFRRAKETGFRLYAHAGETDGPQSVWDAINKLQVERIGHGIQAVKDEALMDHLAKEKIALDISITSNYLTNSVEKGEEHPIKQLISRNIPVSLNTDDPGFFAVTLNSEYLRFCKKGFTIDSLKKLQVDAIKNAFLSEEEKELLISKLK